MPTPLENILRMGELMREVPHRPGCKFPAETICTCDVGEKLRDILEFVEPFLMADVEEPAYRGKPS